MKSKNYVYLIRCPKDKAVIYVGQTCNPKSRFSFHKCGIGKTPIAKYMKELRDCGLIPIFEIIQEFPMSVRGLILTNKSERENIFKYYNDKSARILNRYMKNG